MITYQQCKKNSFEEKILKRLNINDNPNIKCFIGFDFGFFRGVNVYYKNDIDENIKNNIYQKVLESKINLRLFTNYNSEYDVIILLGYTNLRCERKYIKKNIDKFLKLFTFL